MNAAFMKKVFTSKVRGFEGRCKPTWLNRNQVFNQIDGGVTGFFKNVKRVWWWPFPIMYGEEFHGMIKPDLTIESTAIA